MNDYKHSDLTGKIIGCAMEVHIFLGNGFPEVAYQRALAIELEWGEMRFVREFERGVFYKHVEDPIWSQRADFVVDDKVLVEVKAVANLEDVHVSQILGYLKAFRLEVGLLINFGAKSLQFKRFVLTP
jgi:GxxExxY protein